MQELFSNCRTHKLDLLTCKTALAFTVTFILSEAYACITDIPGVCILSCNVNTLDARANCLLPSVKLPEIVTVSPPVTLNVNVILS